MAFISYNKLLESEFNIVNIPKRDKLQDLKNNPLKLEVHDTNKKDEKITTDLEPIKTENVINKGYLDDKILKINGHFSSLERDYNEYILQYNKQCVEEI